LKPYPTRRSSDLVILLRNAALSGNQIEAGRCSAGELTITSPLFRQTFSQLRGAIAIEGTLNARERKLGGFLTASGNSLSLFNRQIDRLTAKINLKADTIEFEQFEVARKKDFIRAQGKIDIAHESDYSGSIEAKVGDASEYFLLAR